MPIQCDTFTVSTPGFHSIWRHTCHPLLAYSPRRLSKRPPEITLRSTARCVFHSLGVPRPSSPRPSAPATAAIDTPRPVSEPAPSLTVLAEPSTAPAWVTLRLELPAMSRPMRLRNRAADMAASEFARGVLRDATHLSVWGAAARPRRLRARVRRGQGSGHNRAYSTAGPPSLRFALG
ncbi:hypothetical protein POSPLADRAFT_1059338 [Postia placenta MAD-698-R-SB12]|uniref:Uncharacterized protein n=1 Tax=Postia placenta MAD-698-R-SB12 TaxID=670580 RepID=A0A1X6MUK4_9APHY|nr:hypothetical protein POSPLADRAFT_1059338 [Postia placenta MAD-698-R-SB12]OSX60055.1 hypothetical protein POSPLADRAFT_1059338 [Postia placenta MAD-698-R-SB12]